MGRISWVILLGFVLTGLILTCSKCHASDDPGTRVVDANYLTVALKWISYRDGNRAVADPGEVRKIVQKINSLYSVCDLRFEVEEYDAIDPATKGLGFAPAAMSDLDSIRAAFDTPREIVVIETGAWHGKLGEANAWTTMPGSSPSGTVIESPFAKLANLVAHELGHYLNLDHVEDDTNLMNTVTYDRSRNLQPWQCRIVRQTATGEREQALRRA